MEENNNNQEQQTPAGYQPNISDAALQEVREYLLEEEKKIDFINRDNRFKDVVKSGGRNSKKYNGIEWIKIELGRHLSVDNVNELVLHIMPYRFCMKDLNNVYANKFNGKFPDIDCNSGNMHKEKGDEIQLVLVTKNVNPAGPGLKEGYDLNSDEWRLTIKKDWYYPPIDGLKSMEGEEEGEFEKRRLHLNCLDYSFAMLKDKIEREESKEKCGCKCLLCEFVDNLNKEDLVDIVICHLEKVIQDFLRVKGMIDEEGNVKTDESKGEGQS